MNEETIDVSQWLNQSFHKAYPHAMQHIEHGENGRYYTSRKLAFDSLYLLGILNDSQLASAEFLFTLNEVATNKTGYARMLTMVQDREGGDKISGFCPSTLLKLINQQMSMLQWSQVERICVSHVRANDLAWIQRCRVSTRIAFEALGKAIEISVDTLKKRLEDSKNYEGVAMPGNHQPA